MQHDDISTWFILTLSAEQAVFDQDFEHLEALLKREELLLKWKNSGFRIDEKDRSQIESAEARLDSALRRVQEGLGKEMSLLHSRKKAATVYQAS